MSQIVDHSQPSGSSISSRAVTASPFFKTNTVYDYLSQEIISASVNTQDDSIEANITFFCFVLLTTSAQGIDAGPQAPAGILASHS